MDWKRVLRHLCTGSRAVTRAFDAAALRAVEEAVARAEAAGAGEIRFAVEDSLGLDDLRAGLTPRARAIEVFGEQRVWDTQDNDGILIYVLLADRDVEIVADRGITGVTPAQWEACCRAMEAHFREGRFGAGAVAGVDAVAALVARGPRRGGAGPGNELPDAPALL